MKYRKAEPVLILAAFLLCGHGLGQEGGAAKADTNTPAASPVRIEPVQYLITREASYPMEPGMPAARTNAQAVLSLNATVDSTLLVAGAAMELSELRDNTGRDLLTNAGPGIKFGYQLANVLESRRGFSTSFDLRSRFPDARATALQSIKGKIILAITQSIEPVRIDLKKPGAPLVFAGINFTFMRLERVAQTGYTVVLVNSNAMDVLRLGRRFRLAEMSTADGRKLAYSKSSIRRTKGQLPEVLITFQWMQNVDPVSVLMPDEAIPQRQEYPFEYHDLPLPPLQAAYASAASAAPAARVPPLPLPTPLTNTVPLATLPASTVTLTVQNHPVPWIIAEIFRQTGNTLKYRPFGGRSGVTPPSFSVDWKEVSYWQAVSELCRSNNLCENQSELQQVAGYSDQSEPREKIELIGAIRARLLDVRVKTESLVRYGAQAGKSEESSFMLAGEVKVEPRVPLITHGCEVRACVTESGLDLARIGSAAQSQAAPPVSPQTGRDQPGNAEPRVSFSLTAPLRPGAFPGRIAALRVYYSVQASDRAGTPQGIKTYAGWIDFHDIEVPLLPEPLP